LKTFIILDAARAGPVASSGQASGLAWVEPEANMLIAFNAAPGTLVRDASDGYGSYAKALAEMLREGDLTPGDLFDRVRLRVHELTKGDQVPWDASRIEGQFKFLERGPGAPVRSDTAARTARMRMQPMRILGAHDAYMVALLRDTFDAYTDFLADYWQDPMTKRIRALLAARRESITWRRTYEANVPAAYWSYLERYPHGPHAADAGRLLSRLGAAAAPPSKFARLDYDVPPPLPDELEYIERPVLALGDPAFGLEPPPPTPGSFLEPQPAEFSDLRPPAAPSGVHTLPVPTLIPLHAFVRLPADVVATSNPIVFGNAREQEVAVPAADVPAEPEAQVTSSISAMQAPDAAIDIADSVRGRSSPVAPEAQADRIIAPPLTVNQMTTEESKLPMVTSSSTASVASRWPADATTPANQGIAPRTDPSDSGTPFSVPTMLAPSSNDPSIQTWSYGVLSSPTPERTPQQSQPPAPPGANFKPTSAATLPSQPAASNPSSPPHSGTLQSSTSRNHSRPISNTGQPKQQRKPQLVRAPLSTQAARAPKESPEVSPPKP
jgi:uncharacterized caspase-like protein